MLVDIAALPHDDQARQVPVSVRLVEQLLAVTSNPVGGTGRNQSAVEGPVRLVPGRIERARVRSRIARDTRETVVCEQDVLLPRRRATLYGLAKRELIEPYA